jgi:hypothetical protein
METNDCPVEVMADLWRAKFGTEWVDPDTIDEFYEAMLNTLRVYERTDRIAKANEFCIVYRLKEAM